MENYLLDWANLLLRWLHVIAAISWIGESIYFVMLDNGLKKPTDEPSIKRGVFGEMFAVHGGGFYHSQKYLTNPPFELNDDVHWSYWKSYTTWLSGFALFALLYLANASIYLVDPAKMELSGAAASAIAVAFLVGGWVVYDALCRLISPTMNRDGVLSIAVAVMVIAVAYATSHIFQGRAAFLITGAVMATCMSANVFFWIIPGQRRMFNDIKAGRAPNPLDGKRGKQRSVHNTYFTLPVVFLMISNHYAFTYSHEQAWLIMSLIIVSGALIRQFFVLMHAGKKLYALPAAGTAVIVAALFVGAPQRALESAPVAEAAPAASADGSAPAAAVAAGVSYDAIHDVMEKRCVACHAAKPTQPGFAAAPAGLVLDQESVVRANAARINTAVKSKYMPLGNMTQMTDEERALVDQWVSAGAK
ncbi:putative membrane protein [Crenobacter luteus]|uniref:urate hydroxylase PuuD n=1 Tax=Crenobacter luteus TaxID=1452487 RepID=UPI001052D70C|nr:urate hydroxylase PuuD [Crenobacter luteus]TCP15698.1 putative membrane protein [Crenobacter luteus]